MRTFVTLAIVLLFLAPAYAEEDYMEAQRCIWRCLADSRGADDPAYHRCVARQCSGDESPKQSRSKARSKQSKAAGLKSPAADGVWAYGDHPTLGLSAHVNVGQEAFGVACVKNPDSGWIGAMRTTRGLVPRAGGGQVITAFSEPFSLSSASVYQGGDNAYMEETGDACMLPIARLRSAKELVYLNGDKSSMNAEGDVTVLTYEHNGEPIRISDQADLDAVTDKVVVPLKGSTKAIDKLLAACPTLRASFAEGCDTGD